MADEYYIKNPKKQSLTEQQMFGISLGLIIAEQNGAYMDSLETGDTDYPQKQMMVKNWSIKNRNDALHFLNARIEQGHRALFNRLLEIYISQGCKEANKINFAGTEFDPETIGVSYDDENEDEDEDEAEVDKVPLLLWTDVIGYLENLDEILELEDGNTWLEGDCGVGADAWDFGRIIFVSRVCYSLEYITESEAWGYINRIADMAKQRFDNWEDYATSYLLGRAMWIGNDSGGWEDVAAFASDAVYSKKSPWKKLKWK